MMKAIYPLILIWAVVLSSCGGKTATDAEDIADSCRVSFCADSAFCYVERQCDFGPRVPGSAAHTACGDWIVAQFGALGLEVEEQKVPLQMWDGQTFTCRNIIARSVGVKTGEGAETLAPVVICAHWDSRPWADADPNPANHTQPVMAANDGASGVAVMLELARLLPQIGLKRPVHFVCFDLEDYGKDDQENSFALGAQHWARVNKTDYDWGVLLDMVGGRDAHFCYEGYSMRYAPWLVARTWGVARSLGYGDIFVSRDGGYITDDHGPMNEAGIPTIDIIPYYAEAGVPSFGPTWHTVQDTPENISRETLGAVGQTLIQLLYENDN